MLTLVQVVNGPDLDEVRRLFSEYAAWIGINLSFQNFSQELAELPGLYVAPSGVLLLARIDGNAIGCVAAHQWSASVCEMKRLFVRESVRGCGHGRALVERTIAWARDAGYDRIILDTLPAMHAAQCLYARLGFREIPPYRHNPVPGAKFMELVLSS